MKIVVAPDSYKGSLTAVEVASVMRDAILAVDERIEVVVKPMADGGEGTLDSLIDATGSEKVAVLCNGATGRQQTSHFGITPEQIALIEMANIAGLEQVAAADRHPGRTTTIGVGESCWRPTSEAADPSSSAWVEVPPMMAGWACYRHWACVLSMLRAGNCKALAVTC